MDGYRRMHAKSSPNEECSARSYSPIDCTMSNFVPEDNDHADNLNDDKVEPPVDEGVFHIDVSSSVISEADDASRASRRDMEAMSLGTHKDGIPSVRNPCNVT